MAAQLQNYGLPIGVHRTKLADAVLKLLEDQRLAVVPLYSLFLAMRRLYAPENRQKLYLRSKIPTQDDLEKLRGNLSSTGAIEIDPDYGRSLYRVPSVGESSADEVCALANPFGYISHLSAMQRWGLTDRRPEALHLTMPPANAAQPLLTQRMAADYGTPFADLPQEEAIKLHFLRHPKSVRGRKITVHESRHMGRWLPVRESHARLATVGQTFADTVDRPQNCGGMAYIIDVWRSHAGIYREEIISTIDELASPIAKVRAGYLLDDMLGIGDDQRIQGWIRFAQRGSSRVLDPSKNFAQTYSEKWMLSINV